MNIKNKLTLQSASLFRDTVFFRQKMDYRFQVNYKKTESNSLH
jgi:hypothetical protein